MAVSDILSDKSEMEEVCPRPREAMSTLTEDILLQIFLQLEPDLRQLNTLLRVSRTFHRLAQHPLLWERVFHASGYVLPTPLQNRLRGTVQHPPGKWDGIRFEWNSTTAEMDDEEPDDEWTLMKPSIRCSVQDRPPSTKRSDSIEDWWSSTNALSIQDRGPQVGRHGVPGQQSNEDKQVADGGTPRRIPIHWPTLLRSMHVYDSRVTRADFRRIRVLQGHVKAVYSAKFQGSRMVSCSRDQTIGFWRLGTADARGRVTETKLISRIETPHSRSVVSIAFDFDCETPFNSEDDEEAVPDSQPRDKASMLVSSSSDGSLAIWRVVWSDERPAQGEEEKPIEVELVKIHRDGSGPVYDVILTPSRIVAASADGFIRTYNRQTLELAETLENGPLSVNAVAQTRPGEEAFVAVGIDPKIVEWTWTGDSWLSKTTEIETHKIATIDVKDGHFAVGGSERIVKIYRDGEVCDTCKGHIDTIRAIALDPGRPLMVSADYQGAMMIWDLERMLFLKIERSPDNAPVFGIHMREGRLVAALGDGNMLELVFGMGLPYQSLLHQMKRSAPLRMGEQQD